MIIKKEREGDRKGAKKKTELEKVLGSWERLDDFSSLLSSFQDCSYHKIHSVKQWIQFSVYKLAKQVTKQLGGLFVCVYVLRQC